MKDFLDELRAIWSEIWDKSSRLVNYIGTIIRWILITIIPIFLGVLLPIVFRKYIELGLKFTLTDLISYQSFLLYWPIVLSLFISGVGHLWRITGTRRAFQERLMYYVLKWLYSDLGFEKNADADVRCTLWVPINSRVSPEKMRLVQIVNYVPRYERTPREYAYRMNKDSGRIRHVARLEGEVVKPIGIVGKNVIESLRDQNPYIMFENIEDDVNFIDRMIHAWNFTKANAKRLTADRRSYMSMALMDSGRTDILGILFMDSKNPYIFTKRIGDKAQKYLPRIAQLLTY